MKDLYVVTNGRLGTIQLLRSHKLGGFLIPPLPPLPLFALVRFLDTPPPPLRERSIFRFSTNPPSLHFSHLFRAGALIQAIICGICS